MKISVMIKILKIKS